MCDDYSISNRMPSLPVRCIVDRFDRICARNIYQYACVDNAFYLFALHALKAVVASTKTGEGTHFNPEETALSLFLFLFFIKNTCEMAQLWAQAW